MHEKPIGWDGMAGMARVQVPTSTWTQLLEANSRRIAIMLGTITSANLQFAFGDLTPALGGVKLDTLNSPILLSRYLHGGIVTRGWWVFQTSGITLTISAFEAFEE